MRIFFTFLILPVLYSSLTAFAQEEKQQKLSSAKEFYDQGQTAASQGDTAAAIDSFEKSIETDPDFAQAYSALGSVYLDNSGSIDDIIWLFQQAADLEPQNAENYTNMCRAYFQSQKPDWAEAACLKSLSIEPNSGSAQLTLAWIYLLGKVQPADSVKYFNAVIEKIPNNPKIFYGLGMAYARNNEQSKALEVITNLRSMGQESLASQLEKMVRASNAPPPSTEDIMQTTAAERPPVDASPSKVVKASVEELPPVAAVDPDAPPPGMIRIQLKAKLPPTNPANAATTKTQQAKAEKLTEDDSYGPEDYKPLSVKERQARVERMRGNRRTGRANASVSLQGSASGTGTVTRGAGN